MACAIEALRFVNASSAVLIHDAASGGFGDRRVNHVHYLRGVAPFYETVRLRGTLRHLRARPEVLSKARSDSAWFEWAMHQALQQRAPAAR